MTNMYQDTIKSKLDAIHRQEKVNILAFETSCDDTSISIVQNGRQVIADVVSSQIQIHNLYGGVVPEIASRKHIEWINQTLESCMKKAGLSYCDIDAVSATYGPGLVGSLLVGLNAAKAAAFALSIPFIGVNHMEAHVAANYITSKDLVPPFLCLVVSGGHTQIVAVEDYRTFRVIGETQDDAVGEAFDKISRELGLGYPGGPLIEKLAQQGDAHAIPFPHAKLKTGAFDFSFSGLKTAVLNYLHNAQQRGEAVNTANVAASFQYTAVSDLVQKTISAAKLHGYKKIALAGGVAANKLLREMLRQECNAAAFELFVPEFHYCTDNASMVACAAYYQLRAGDFNALNLNAKPQLEIGER